MATKERAIKLRLTSQEELEWLKAAKMEGVTLSQWIRNCCKAGSEMEVGEILLPPEIPKEVVEAINGEAEEGHQRSLEPEGEPEAGVEKEYVPLSTWRREGASPKRAVGRKKKAVGKGGEMDMSLCPHNFFRATCSRCNAGRGA